MKINKTEGNFKCEWLRDCSDLFFNDHMLLPHQRFYSALMFLLENPLSLSAFRMLWFYIVVGMLLHMFAFLDKYLVSALVMRLRQSIFFLVFN